MLIIKMEILMYLKIQRIKYDANLGNFSTIPTDLRTGNCTIKTKGLSFKLGAT